MEPLPYHQCLIFLGTRFHRVLTWYSQRPSIYCTSKYTNLTAVFFEVPWSDVLPCPRTKNDLAPHRLSPQGSFDMFIINSPIRTHLKFASTIDTRATMCNVEDCHADDHRGQTCDVIVEVDHEATRRHWWPASQAVKHVTRFSKTKTMSTIVK